MEDKDTIDVVNDGDVKTEIIVETTPTESDIMTTQQQQPIGALLVRV